jgi:hypothetical protein
MMKNELEYFAYGLDCTWSRLTDSEKVGCIHCLLDKVDDAFKALDEIQMAGNRGLANRMKLRERMGYLNDGAIFMASKI